MGMMLSSSGVLSLLVVSYSTEVASNHLDFSNSHLLIS